MMDEKLLKAFKNLCPKKGGGISSITISLKQDGQIKDSVTLLPETREAAERLLKKINKENKGNK